MIFVSSKTSDGNMSLILGNKKETLNNRRKFFQSLNIRPKDIAEVTQVHGNKVIVVEAVPDPSVEADSLITNNENVYLMLKVADCMAIGFYDQKHKAIGLAHAGWKGLEKGIIEKTILSMNKNFNTSPKDLLVKISPSIGPCHYHLDIWKQAEDQLLSLGILKENIENPKICTYHNKDYFSHRESEDQNLKERRFVTILGLC